MSALRVSHGARSAVLRRCQGRCERCGLEWPWELYVFLGDPAAPAAARNLLALCLACSAGRAGPFAPLLATPSLRDRLRARNNGRTGAAKLTDARRRKLIQARGARCERCGIPGTERQLEVHHRLGVFRGGDDSEQNLEVLCFACHHHVQPCAAACGRWAKLPAKLCRRCQTERRLAELGGGRLGRRMEVRLRPVLPDEADLLEAWDAPQFTAPFNDFGLPSRARRPSLEATGLLGDDRGTLMVEAGEEPVGTVSWHPVRYGPNVESTAFNIGINLVPAARGRGIGAKAQRLLADRLFEMTPYNRVEACTDVENAAEQRSLEKAGFTREGVLRGAQHRGGALHDLVIYARLREDS